MKNHEAKKDPKIILERNFKLIFFRWKAWSNLFFFFFFGFCLLKELSPCAIDYLDAAMSTEQDKTNYDFLYRFLNGFFFKFVFWQELNLYLLPFCACSNPIFRTSHFLEGTANCKQREECQSIKKYPLFKDKVNCFQPVKRYPLFKHKVNFLFLSPQ